MSASQFSIMEISRAARLVLTVLIVQGSILFTLTFIALFLHLPFLAPLLSGVATGRFALLFLFIPLLSELPLPTPFLSSILLGMEFN